MLAVPAALQIGNARAGRSGKGLVAVAAQHKVDRGAWSELLGGPVGGPVDQQDGCIAQAAGFQLCGDAPGNRIVLIDAVPHARELRSHDAAGVVDREADDADPDGNPRPFGVGGRFLDDDIVLGGGHPAAVAVEVGADDRYLIDAFLPLPGIVRHRGVRVHEIVDPPVELVIADGHGVVPHPVHGDINGLPAEQVRNGCSLVDIPSVEQQQAAFVVVVAPSADVVDLVGDKGHAIVERSVRRADDIAVKVRRFNERQLVFSRQVASLLPGIRDPRGRFFGTGRQKGCDKKRKEEMQ